VSADNPPKPNTLSIWQRRINIGTTGMPVGLFSIIAYTLLKTEGLNLGFLKVAFFDAFCADIGLFRMAFK